MNNTSNTYKQEYKKLTRRLRLQKDLSSFNYRGERTLVVISGMNSDILNLRKVKGLMAYEERMLFFLFLLRYKKTKIVYITSEGFNEKLFDYYLSLISDDEKEIAEMKSRLIWVEVNSKKDKVASLTQKILDSKSVLNKIGKSINDPKLAQIRCYNPGALERKLSVKLGIPLFGGLEKFDYLGTKSGGRKVFRLAKLNIIPGYSYLKNFTELSVAMVRLMKDYPYYKKLMVKLNTSASGRGNAIFAVKDFLKENDVEISVKADTEKIARLIRKNFCKYVSFQMKGQECSSYLKEFNTNGGIVELYIPGKVKCSPSVQMSITPAGKIHVLSTHEQILGGADKQEYLGCIFPAKLPHRPIIIKEAKKVAKWMAKKGMVGHFGIDFVVVYKEEKNKTDFKVYPIEINLRKGGTTHPFRIAYFLTGAKYNSRKGMLYCGQKPIFYVAVDKIESEKYKKLKPMELVKLISDSKISFNKDTKTGVLVYLPGLVKKYGKFGAISIGHNREEVQKLYDQMIKLVDSHVSK